MKSFINVSSDAVTAALMELKLKVGDVSPVLAVLGEDMAERTKRRFSTTTAPDGTKWRANSMVTIINYLRKRGYTKKTGKINPRGQLLAMSKRPLQGRTNKLASEIFSAVVENGQALTLKSNKAYARMQQKGGTRAQFKQLWGDIPARPFMPLTVDNQLDPTEEALILERIRQYITS